MTLRAAATAAAVALAFTLTATRPAPAFAATTVTVNTTLDETQVGNGTCSLREATLYANGVAEPDCATVPPSGLTTITVPAGVYVLTGGALSLTGNAAIAGADAATTTITAAGESQVFVVAATASATISDVTVTGGNTGTVCGGGMCGLGQPLFGIPGGGIANAGSLSLTRVIVSGNSTGAGAINPQCTSRQSRGRVFRRQRRRRRRHQQHGHAHHHELDDHRELHRRWSRRRPRSSPTSRPATPAAGERGAESATPAR